MLLISYNLFSVDSKYPVLLVLLDLTAALDTVDHSPSVPERFLSTALMWFASSLSVMTAGLSSSVASCFLWSSLGLLSRLYVVFTCCVATGVLYFQVQLRLSLLCGWFTDLSPCHPIEGWHIQTLTKCLAHCPRHE